MRFLSNGFASVILFMVAKLAIDYTHPVPVQLALFALVAGMLAVRFALAAFGFPRRCSINHNTWRV